MKICPKCGKAYDPGLRVCPDDNVPLVSQAAAASDPMITRELAGRYLIIEKLGQGGMGTVYKAMHTQMDRTCAVKLLSPASGDSQSAIARFKREAKMASRIDNPHAITIYDFGQAEGGLLYLAMEYIDGRPLSSLLAQEHRLSVERTVRITTQICEALAAAHSIGIVHRDLKPDNIMLTRKGADMDYVKVLDFGIAKSVTEDSSDNLTRTGFILGTPVYMSPEQLSGEQLDARSDVYSLAIMVYEMLSGRLPFEGDNAQAVMVKRLTNDPVDLRVMVPSISESIARAVMRALARNRNARTSSVAEFASELSNAAFSGTQMMGSRETGNITEQASGRSTVAITDRHTIQEPGGGTGSSGGQTNPSGVANRAADSFVTSAPPEQGRGSQPPSAYVTNRSAEVASPTTPQMEAGYIKPTVESAYAQPPETRYVPQPTVPLPHSAQGQTAPQAQSSNKTMLVVGAIVLVIVAGMALAGYLIFSGSGDEVKPTPQAQTTQPAGGGSTATQPSGGNSGLSSAEQALQHYNLGKRHQEQAYMLANAGARAEADDENKRAIAEYRQAVTLRPDYPQAHENLGVALYNIGDYESALAEYRTAIDQYIKQDQKPTAQVMTNYGLALFDLKRYRDAADAFERALELDETDTDLHALRGFALHNTGDKEAARAEYQKYLSRAPSGQYAEAIRQVLAGRATPPADSGNR